MISNPIQIHSPNAFGAISFMGPLLDLNMKRAIIIVCAP